MNLQQRETWCARAHPARGLDRRSFIALSGAAAAGQYDEARPVTLAQFAARVPAAEFAVIPGAADGFLSDRPEEALGILRPWLRSQDAA